jgi:hypothetical protein
VLEETQIESTYVGASDKDGVVTNKAARALVDAAAELEGSSDPLAASVVDELEALAARCEDMTRAELVHAISQLVDELGAFAEDETTRSAAVKLSQLRDALRKGH